MNKKDFWTMLGFDFTVFVLLIEHIAGLELAFELMIATTIISLLVHIHILKDYVRLAISIEEE